MSIDNNRPYMFGLNNNNIIIGQTEPLSFEASENPFALKTDFLNSNVFDFNLSSVNLTNNYNSNFWMDGNLLPFSFPNFNFPNLSFNLPVSFGSSDNNMNIPLNVKPLKDVSVGSVFTASGGKRKTKTSYKKSYTPVSKDARAKLGPEFLARVKEVAKNINCDYKDLLAVMNAESGLNASIKNKAGSRNWGLIQFGDAAAKDMGTTIEELVQMTPLKQLDYVEKFYLNARKKRGWGNKPFSAGDLYAITFLPARAKNYVLCVEGERDKNGKLLKYYESNKWTDINGNNDGKIDKEDLEIRINRFRVDEHIFYA